MMTDEQIKNTAEYNNLTEDQVKDIIEKTNDVAKTMEMIKSNEPTNGGLNRQQRRKLQHKAGKNGREAVNMMAEYTKKLYYINLIQKLQALNEKRRLENERANENN